MYTQPSVVMFFDKDGTLLPESENFKHLGYRQGFQELGFDLEPSSLEPYEGKDGSEAKVFLREIIREQLQQSLKNRYQLRESLINALRLHNLEDNQGLEDAVSSLLISIRQTRERFMMEMLSKKQICLIPEFLRFLSVNQKYIGTGRLVLALVTSDSRKLAQHFLDVYGLNDFFKCLVSIDDVAVGSAKPSSLPYKLAYQSTSSGSIDSACYFFEDSDSGIISACSAIEELGISCRSELYILPTKSSHRPERSFPTIRSRRVSNLQAVLASISMNLAQDCFILKPSGL